MVFLDLEFQNIGQSREAIGEASEASLCQLANPEAEELVTGRELRDFLKTGDDGQGISRWESCHSISVFLHMLFQEHKDTRLLRRWFHKRLQIELNDISTRSAAGRLIQVSSQIQGHQLKRLIPLIKESIRRALQRKHVWPNYKIRYRPLFPNPFLQPSPPLSAFAHIKIEGGLEVTVLQASRLRTALVEKDPSCYVVYCTATLGVCRLFFALNFKNASVFCRLDHRPFMQSSTDVAHSLSVMLTFSRHDMNTPTGLIFEKEIRIRDLSLGTKFPRINAIRVENVEMAEDKNIFEKITLLIDMDYTGGLETSIDVTTVFGKKANLSIKLTKLAGLVRLILSRKPYSHWTSSFVSTPDVSSQIRGSLKRLFLIKESIRRALQRKHVWPNYKIRYRPLFPNPFLQPSPPLSAFAHIKIEGGLEVTVLQASRLRTALVEKDPSCYVVYCTATLGTAINANGSRPVRVAIVEEGSLADKAAFKPGDTLLAINNVPIRSERQVVRFLQQTIGDLLILVDRNLDDIDDEALKDSEHIVGSNSNGNNDDGFVCLGEVAPPPATVAERRSVSPGSDSHRRHSLSNIASAASMVNTNTDSVASSLLSLGMI
ncbi:hypothetical protein OSTOST_10368, partial [Ostertagia ostertagi]